MFVVMILLSGFIHEKEYNKNKNFRVHVHIHAVVPLQCSC